MRKYAIRLIMQLKGDENNWRSLLPCEVVDAQVDGYHAGAKFVSHKIKKIKTNNCIIYYIHPDV